MSFGMIFSIILIIIFITFSFTVIRSWLELGTITQIESFVDTLQKDVNEIWAGSQGSQVEQYSLPNKVGMVCFVDYSSPAKGSGTDMQDYMDRTSSETNNLFFYPKEILKYVENKEIEHINISKITLNSNPFCIEHIRDKKVSMVLQKNYNDVLVNIN